ISYQFRKIQTWHTLTESICGPLKVKTAKKNMRAFFTPFGNVSLTEVGNTFGIDYSLMTITVALKPVARFHRLEEITAPLSSYTMNSAVLGPDEPWFSASKSILLNPSSSCRSNPL